MAKSCRWLQLSSAAHFRGQSGLAATGQGLLVRHAEIPYFYVAELGGFELYANRGRKRHGCQIRYPFSFFAMTQYQGSVCLPVYEANAGATDKTIEHYEPIFGKAEFLEFLRLAVLGDATEPQGRSWASSVWRL